jgi:hypothetical protein
MAMETVTDARATRRRTEPHDPTAANPLSLSDQIVGLNEIADELAASITAISLYNATSKQGDVARSLAAGQIARAAEAAHRLQDVISALHALDELGADQVSACGLQKIEHRERSRTRSSAAT